MIVRINDKQIYRGKNDVLEVFHAAIESGEKHVELLTDNYERIIEVDDNRTVQRLVAANAPTQS